MQSGMGLIPVERKLLQSRRWRSRKYCLTHCLGGDFCGCPPLRRRRPSFSGSPPPAMAQGHPFVLCLHVVGDYQTLVCRRAYRQEFAADLRSINAASYAIGVINVLGNNKGEESVEDCSRAVPT